MILVGVVEGVVILTQLVCRPCFCEVKQLRHECPAELKEGRTNARSPSAASTRSAAATATAALQDFKKIEKLVKKTLPVDVTMLQRGSGKNHRHAIRRRCSIN